jgi:hypothetical protein
MELLKSNLANKEFTGQWVYEVGKIIMVKAYV